MVIRARIAWFLARPLLFTITIAGAGLTYGTFKITRGVFHKVLVSRIPDYQWISHKDHLLIDRAIPFQVHNIEEHDFFTGAVSLSAHTHIDTQTPIHPDAHVCKDSC